MAARDRIRGAQLRGAGYVHIADQIEAQTKPPRIPEPGWSEKVLAHTLDDPTPREYVRFTDSRDQFSTRQWYGHGGRQGAQMMVSGGVDVSYDDPISCVVATAGGAPVQAIFGGTPSLAFLIVGGPVVKTIADVKGKRVGSSGLGLSASRLALLVGFRRFGLDADKGDITIVAAGQEPERMAALSAGAIAASVVSPEYRNKLEALGVNMLADLRTLGIPWETASVITTAKNIQTKRDMMERVIRSLLQANAFILNPANRARVADTINTQLGLKNPQEAAAIYDDLIKFYVFKKPYPTREALTNIITEVAKSVP